MVGQNRLIKTDTLATPKFLERTRRDRGTIDVVEYPLMTPKL